MPGRQSQIEENSTVAIPIRIFVFKNAFSPKLADILKAGLVIEGKTAVAISRTEEKRLSS